MDLGESIKKIMWEQRLNQTGLAKEIGCSQNTLSAYIHGKRTPNYTILQKLNEFARKNNLDIKLL